MNEQVVSNMVGDNDQPIDRIYGEPASGGSMKLINKDFTEYKGKIHKRALSISDFEFAVAIVVPCQLNLAAASAGTSILSSLWSSKQ